LNPPEDLAEALARAGAAVGRFRGHVRWFADVASTNDVAAAGAGHGAPEGAVVIADAQSAGRGRHGRAWVSPAGAGLYASVVLRPASDALALLTIAAGVAGAEAFEKATGLATALKWPNHGYMGGRKLAGCLAESTGADLTVGPYTVILGIGINVMPAAYPPAIAARATSHETELGRSGDRGLLLAELLCALVAQYAALAGPPQAVVAAWRRRAAPMRGRRVPGAGGGRTVSGIAEDIDGAGALLVRTGTGAGTERITSGEVIWEP
jgi:BirA family biotin operon repressor/biotin-[acetyl-CoA-carboxylase] ligase